MTSQEIDKKHIWHPYTQHKTAGDFPVMVKGEGARLWDENNKEYIDAIASWWVNPYGHANKYIADCIYKQLITLEHVLFGGFTHAPAVELTQELLKILPKNQQKIFFSDNGSTSIEVALKTALQYHHNQGIQKNTIVAFEDAFHGDTFGAMSVSGISLFTEVFKGQTLNVQRIPVPVKGKEQETKQKLLQILTENQVAAFIFEPLVLGAAGMVMYAPETLDELISICKAHSVLTIADEVMTGFGKTGKIFACDYLKEQPDMMCLSKALTAGVLPMSITTFTQKIYDVFYDEDVNKALFHGHSFTANPVGCAAAIASLELLQTRKIQSDISRVNQLHTEFKQVLANHPKVENIRLLGVILAFEVKTNQVFEYYGGLRNKMYNYFIEQGVILRPVGNIIYILPPYIITDEQLKRVYEVVLEVLDIIE
jgi:adenosylmethionine-8-amino-7-oxononanoate aminotransferase